MIIKELNVEFFIGLLTFDSGNYIIYLYVEINLLPLPWQTPCVLLSAITGHVWP